MPAGFVMRSPTTSCAPCSRPAGLLRAGQKHRNVRRRVLPIAIHGQRPGEPEFERASPASRQGRAFAASPLPTDDLGAGFDGPFRRAIRRAIVHYNHRRKQPSHLDDQRFQGGRLVQAGNHYGALRCPIHGADARENGLAAKTNLTRFATIRFSPFDRTWHCGKESSIQGGFQKRRDGSADSLVRANLIRSQKRADTAVRVPILNRPCLRFPQIGLRSAPIRL